MKKKPTKSRWIENSVDASKEHIKLLYGDASKDDWSKFVAVALLSPPSGSVFHVQFLGKASSAINKLFRNEVIRDLNFYLVELKKEDPWGYAIYHCSTGANLYSKVHWAYYPKGDKNRAIHSELISRGDKKFIFKPEINRSQRFGRKG